ncbi:MAG: glycosyltransferase [Marinilabiliaceae bacterium]|nr:glycosyltransferase [Marinilabiliaceae bacterium]
MIEDNPLVSIALCTYNGERFLREQMDSLINQSYRNIEIVVSDDVSTDSTIDIIEEYKKNDPRIRLSVNKVNLGFNLNFEKAINECRGDYIAISDQDDIWCLNKIEVILKNWKEDAVLVHHAVKSFEAFPLPELTEVLEKPGLDGSCVVAPLLFRNSIQGCTIVFKKDVRELMFPLKSEILYDWSIALCAAANGRVQYIHKYLLYHRKHSNSAHYSKHIKKDRLRDLNVFKTHAEYFNTFASLQAKHHRILKNYTVIINDSLRKEFSIKSWFFYFKHARDVFFYKKKRFPYFSYMIHALKMAKGK